jgi:tRNA(fMet)-specific endonuclease VapC
MEVTREIHLVPIDWQYIAAHALSVNCVLVTNNEKDFSRVPDLQIENWIS